MSIFFIPLNLGGHSNGKLNSILSLRLLNFLCVSETLKMGLSDLKITVKSILTSSQKPLTPRELLRDFKEIEGYDFPYQKLGFSDFLQCLQSQDMSDAVKVCILVAQKIIEQKPASHFIYLLT